MRCESGHYSVPIVERKVEELYAALQIDSATQDVIRAELRQDLPGHRPQRTQDPAGDQPTECDRDHGHDRRGPASTWEPWSTGIQRDQQPEPPDRAGTAGGGASCCSERYSPHRLASAAVAGPGGFPVVAGRGNPAPTVSR